MTDRMTTDATLDDLAIFGDDCAYDPLEVVEEKDADEIAETFGYRGSPEEAEQSAEHAKSQLGVRERIERLFEDMPPYRRWLISIMAACREPQTAQGLEGVVEGLKSRRRSVYGTANFCAMLEEAGALERLTLDGRPYEEVQPQLVEVEEDGRRFLRPVPAPEAMWRTTPEALEVLDADDPLDDLLRIVDEESAYSGVFQEILQMCDGDGSSINQIKEQVNANPVLEYPKKTAQFFMDYLDRNGAIVWDGAWKMTEVGRSLLDRLADR